MTPNSQTQLPLDELNQMIAKQKGISIEDLAVTEEGKPVTKKAPVKEEIIIDEVVIPEIVVASAPVAEGPVTGADLRSMADKLFKEAQALRKKADEIEPPAKKATTAKADA
jgi:hypothetical protein